LDARPAPDTADEGRLLTERVGDVVSITVDRPAARNAIDQPLCLHASDYIGLNYGAMVYEKSAVIYNYLAAYLGQETFDAMMLAYFEKWKFKHPYPEDLKLHAESFTGKNLSWFFDELINTRKRIDYSIGKIKLQTLSIPLTINWRIANVLALSAGTQFSLVLDRNETLLKNAGNTFSNGDMALLGGANVTRGKFRVNGRYAIGLKNLNDIDNQDKWKSQTLQLGLGFVF
jgi:hypothetical protein